MKRIIPIALLATLISCDQTKIDKKAEGEKVMQLSKEWSQTVATKDIDKMVSYWADDAFLMQEGQAPLKGKQAIRQMVEESFKIPGFSISWQPESVEVSDNGDMAYMIENAQVSFTDSTGKAVRIKNKAVTIWRKLPDGSWKNVVDISTADPSQNK
ncbi:MAG TPA: SgcJ/EcaC family oxidoreductase [Chitinophagaceae bacterium]|nr:SgcJ/EcaC family oxidoreductase [Chitinophagaceae bacterium]